MHKLRCVYSVLKMAEDSCDQDDESTVILVKKPNAMSIVWNYFGLETKEELQKVIKIRSRFVELAEEGFQQKVETQVT